MPPDRPLAPLEHPAPRRPTEPGSARPGAWVQAVVNLGWPIVAYATLGGHAARLGISEIGEMGIGGGLVLGLLPLTLVAVLQVAGGARVPDDGRAWALGVVGPPLLAGLASGGAGLAWVAFEIGALYLAALVAGYAWIVWIWPFSSGRYGAWPADQRRYHWFAASLQGLLVVPGAVSCGLFAVVLVAGADRSPWQLAGYAVAWAGLTSHEIRWMKVASPLH